MGKVMAVCRSDSTGTGKSPVTSGIFKVEHGLVGDAHAGINSLREVSLLAEESIHKFNQQGYNFKPGDFAENITTSGIVLTLLPVGSKLQLGKDVIFEITQIGKKCHTGCAIYKEVGKCIMPKEGIFAKVVNGGEVRPGDDINLIGETQELNALKEQLRELERQFADTQKKMEANADYRNALIWMSQDINKITARIKALEKQPGHR
jgi:MOSC domain-containing protein YiiM